VLLGIGLLAAPYLKAFRYGTQPWRPRGSHLGLWTLVPLVSIYVLGNLFMIVFSWWPADLQKSLRTTAPIVPSLIGPVLGTVFLIAGAFYWMWDLHVLRWLGYTTEIMAETQDESEMDVRMYVHVSGPLSMSEVLLTDTLQRNINGVALQVYEAVARVLGVAQKVLAVPARWLEY
jgi:hypothetical protein